MDVVLIVIVFIGVLTLLMLNKPVYLQIQTSHKSWVTMLLSIMIIPITISLSYNPIEHVFNLLSIYLLWYIIPCGLLLFTLRYEHFIAFTSSRRQVFLLFVITLAVIILGLGLDIRATKPLYAIFGEAYSINAIQVSLILILFSIKFQYLFPDCPYPLSKRILAQGIKKLAVLTVILVPIGLMSGFLSFEPHLDLNNVLIAPLIFLGIYVTVALPEELLMRAYLLNTLDKVLNTKFDENHFVHWLSLLITSFLFGLSHLNNTTPQFVPWYVLLATIAGMVYGLAWRSGKLHEAVFVHTMVDWIWSFFFSG